MKHPRNIDAAEETTKVPPAKPTLPWPQLLITGREFDDAADQLRSVLTPQEDNFPLRRTGTGWAAETRQFLAANRIAPQRRPGEIVSINPERACQLLYNWVREAKTRRGAAEMQRLEKRANEELSGTAEGNGSAQSLDQLYCKDIVLLLTAIFGLEDNAELNLLRHAPAQLLLLASLLHELYFEKPLSTVSYDDFREQALLLLSTIGELFDVKFDSLPRRSPGKTDDRKA
ncbi:hypothetical protein HYW83_02890 [Candidatus Peregrinibacteria bacterium]|nr:hypothetical protein [Candidatus Peregrinibacteria bacterium]